MGYKITDNDEVNRIIKNVVTYTIHGLAEEDPLVKQFFFERILLEMGMSIRQPREMLGVQVGIPPETEDYLRNIE